MTTFEVQKRSCSNCRGKRIACDRKAPACSQCLHSKRQCPGYGLRLSWPGKGNKKRALTGQVLIWGDGTYKNSTLRLVPVYSRDVELHYRLAALLDNACITRSSLDITAPWNPWALSATSLDLFKYFQHTASQSLPTLGDSAELGNALMRIASAGNTPSGKAVLQSLLALSSVHRGGIQYQAVELKISSLEILLSATKTDLSAHEIIQHIAAAMLLCSFEVHLSSCTSNQWTFYICGAKKLLDNKVLRNSQYETEIKVLKDWIAYHDVMARFTLQHWRPEPNISRSPCGPLAPEPDFHEQTLRQSEFLAMDKDTRNAPYNPLPGLRLLSDFCDVVKMKAYNTMTTSEQTGYIESLKIIDWKVRKLATTPVRDTDIQKSMVSELFYLAILVYMNRATENILDQAARTQQHIDRAFVLFSQLGSCERQFPVFILGCEAWTDAQRAVIIDLISRTRSKVSSRSFDHVRIMIDMVWAQDDLADGKLKYRDKLTAIISCASIVPSLV